MPMKKLLGIGNALVDVLAKVENELILSELDLPKGSMQLLTTPRYSEVSNRLNQLSTVLTTGGSACNTLLAFAALGGQSGLIGRIGHDEKGDFFTRSFQERGIETRLLLDNDLPTGVASTFITPDGQRTFGTYLGAAAALMPDDLRAEWFDSYDYFYIEGYLVQNHALIRRAVTLAREAGLKICLDLASYNIVEADRDFFGELLQETDIVFANEQEAAAFTGVADPKFNLERLARLCDIAVVKIGKYGVMVKHGDEVFTAPARDVPVVVDTTAAGDYFSAGFLAALAAGRSLPDCARLGSLLAGHIIEVVGTSLPADHWNDIYREFGKL